MKEKISQWYRQGLWTAKMVHDAVTKKILTEAEYQEITQLATAEAEKVQK